MADGYSRQSASGIVDGQTITASLFNNEFNAILNAFHATTGHTHDGTAGGGAGINALVSNAITFGTGGNTDVAVTFSGATSSGVLTWMEDEDYFKFSDDLLINNSKKIQFRDSSIYIRSNVDGKLDLVSDGTVAVISPATTVSGTLTVSGATTLSSSLTVLGTTLSAQTVTIGSTLNVIGATEYGTSAKLSSDKKMIFRDSDIFINSSTNGQLDLEADATVKITAPATEVTGTFSIGGTAITACSSTPTNGATTTPISSDWAFDNVKTAVPSGAVFTDTVTTATRVKGTGGSFVSGDITIATSGGASVSQSGNTITIDAVNVDTNTQNQYSISIPTSTTKFRLSGTGHDGSTTDDIEFVGSGATTVTRTNENKFTISSTDTNTTYTADSNYGMSLSTTAFRLANDRRRNADDEDVYTGNTHDYIHFDADVGISFYTAGDEEMRLENDGDLHVDGNIVAYSSTVSDKRLKSDITKISNALDKVGEINGVTFVRNHNGEKAAGIVAQEVMEVLPEAVKSQSLPLHSDDSEKEYYVVEYDAVTGLLVEAVKELKERVEALESK